MDNIVEVLSKTANRSDLIAKEAIAKVIHRVDALIGSRYEQVPFCDQIDREQLILHSRETDAYVLYAARFMEDNADLAVSVGIPSDRKDKSGLDAEVEFLRQELREYL